MAFTVELVQQRLSIRRFLGNKPVNSHKTGGWRGRAAANDVETHFDTAFVQFFRHRQRDVSPLRFPSPSYKQQIALPSLAATNNCIDIPRVSRNVVVRAKRNDFDLFVVRRTISPYRSLRSPFG